MKNIIRGVVIIVSMLLIFMLITACAPGKSMTRDSNTGNQDWDYDKDSDDFGFDNESGSTDNSYQEERKKIYNQRDNRNNDNDDDFNVRSDRNSKGKNIEDMSDDDEFDNGPKKEQYYQTGKASWYGREFHGRATASGEKFNMNRMTAAHKTLPFGTVLLVKNLKNGRETRVKVNDRGPYSQNRIIDLSFAAAKKLNFIRKGETMVGIKILRRGSGDSSRENRKGYDDEPAAFDNNKNRDYDDHDENDDNRRYSNSGNFSLQAGAFYSRRNAKNLRKRLERMFNNTVVIVRDGDLYKVKVKGIESRRTARKYKRMLEEQDISSFIISGSE